MVKQQQSSSWFDKQLFNSVTCLLRKHTTFSMFYLLLWNLRMYNESWLWWDYVRQIFAFWVFCRGLLYFVPHPPCILILHGYNGQFCLGNETPLGWWLQSLYIQTHIWCDTAHFEAFNFKMLFMHARNMAAITQYSVPYIQTYISYDVATQLKASGTNCWL